MKVAGNGQAKVLSPSELQRLFGGDGFTCPRDRALFAICLFTGCRISEALSLSPSDTKGGKIVFRKGKTKGKLKTRTVSIPAGLQEYLTVYDASKNNNFLFPGRHPHQSLTRFGAEKILKAACDRCQIAGASTHSFRRTALTQMSNAGVPLRIIQSISGHTSLTTLQRYLEVTEQQIVSAGATIKI